MAEWFVGPIMDEIIKTCFEYLKDQFSMKDKLERLRENHPKIQAFISAASQAQIIDQNPALNKWMWQLRDVIDEADDLLDDFEYLKHEDQLAGNMEEKKARPQSNILYRSVKKLREGFEHARTSYSNLEKLQEVVQKLDRVSSEVSTFLHLIEITKQEQHDELHKTRETGSLPRNYLIGRGEDKKFVIEWLRKPSSEEHKAHTLHNNISLLSIVGHGGMGKTTLLQHVYEDEITKEFDLKMWVCVSDKFDVKKVIADMLESLKMKRPSLESLHALQHSLKSEVMSKKFLLVLDDIWEEDEERDKSKWENVVAPLAYGGFGSKILITTRMDSIASLIAKVIKRKKEALRLEGLEADECLQLLNIHAFADVENPDAHKKLKFIAGEFIKKLSGSPLAAKVIGGVLNSSLDERHWIKVLNNNLGQNDIISILKLSYTFLPKYLQNCFSFCSIFPQDHIFNKDHLVRMWIALGFIQPSHSNQGEALTLEDIGETYFDVLIKKSFFDKVSAIVFEAIDKTYKMHDLLHELAQSVSTQECFRAVGDEELFLRIPETTRHLSIETSNLEVFQKIRKLKNLRTLRVVFDKNNHDFIDALNEVFEVTRSIRLLDINACLMQMIPEKIGCLMHLRYLGLRFYHVKQMPRSLSKLYHLQFIISNQYSFYEDFFPRDMNNLSNLRYLSYQGLEFPGIGKLKFLQELKGFSVKNEIGYRIGELEHMNDVRILTINDLENVRDVEEVYKAKLCYKRKLTDLCLKWSGIYVNRWNIPDCDVDVKVLDNLQPHNYLKKLSMFNYMGVKSAIWMNNAHLINNLEQIELDGCLEWQILPPFGQLPFLKILSLYNMPKVKRLENKFRGNDKYCVFPSLENLFISKLDALEDWFDDTVDCLFPSLTELKLYDCPNLQKLPYLPPKLKTLEIGNIGWKTLNCFNISKPIALNTLRVFCCPNITITFTDEFKAIKYMEVIDCPNMISLAKVETTKNFRLVLNKLIISDPFVLQIEPLRNVTSIINVMMKGNDKLIFFPFEAEQWFLQVSSSLHELKFMDFLSLQSLPSSLTSISSLVILRLHNLPQLQLLPNIPASMERLELNLLNSLQHLPSLSTISSLKHLKLENIPLIKSFPVLPPYLCELYLVNLANLNCLSSCLPSLSSLTRLYINSAPQLRELPDLPLSLCKLVLMHLPNLKFMPSCLPRLTSLTNLDITGAPQLRELPDLPPSLCRLNLIDLENLERLPPCFLSLSSLDELYIKIIPQLRELIDLPPSLCILKLSYLDNLENLPSCLPSLSSLKELYIFNVPQLRELPDLPPALCTLWLSFLDNLECLPPCIPTLSSLTQFRISKIPQLRELPDLPSSLKKLMINECDPELMKRYKSF